MTILTLLTVFLMTVHAQKATWEHPHAGYTNTSMMKIEKVSFSKKETVVSAVASGEKGESFYLSRDAHIIADGTNYAMKKTDKIKTGVLYTLPDSGKVHFKMHFASAPANTKLIHFVEKHTDEGWKICNISKEKGLLHEAIPAEWRDVTYEEDKNLPKASNLSDDSTTIHVKILNYTPEAGQNVRVVYTNLYTGTRSFCQDFRISNDGTAEIKLQPCMPQTLLMGIGHYASAPVIILPGKDISILADMGEAKDEMAAIAFKGAYAKTNKEINTPEARNIIRYNNSTAYADSLFHASTPFPETLYKSFSANEEAIYNSSLSPTSKHLLQILNQREHLIHKYGIKCYVSKEIEKAAKALTPNASVRFIVSTANYVLDERERDLFSSEYLTLCPEYEFVRLHSPLKQEQLYQDFSGNTNEYNKELNLLFNAIGLSCADADADVTYLLKNIRAPKLREHYDEAMKRWKNKMDMMNNTPHIHFTNSIRLSGKDLRDSLLHTYAGNTTIFVQYDRTVPCSLEKFEELCKMIDSRNYNGTTFIMISHEINASDIDQWYDFSKGKPGEHYKDTWGNYYSMFDERYNPSEGGCHYSIYDKNGRCVLKTKDMSQALKAVCSK